MSETKTEQAEPLTRQDYDIIIQSLSLTQVQVKDAPIILALINKIKNLKDVV